MKSTSGSLTPRPLAIVSSGLRLFPIFLIPVVALLLAAAAPEAWAQKHRGEIPFSGAKIIIEFNASDNDVGVQVLLDGEDWHRLRIEGPDGRMMLDITSSGSLREQGLTELFFESSEPSLDEVPLDVFLARFPEGTYGFEGKTIDGIQLEGNAILTHVIPAGPEIVSPPQGNIPPMVDPGNLVIEWKAVTETMTGSRDITISGYQVVVDGGNPSRRFDVTLSAATTSVKLPPEFLERVTEYAFEVLAIEAGGNQTITAGTFVTQ